MDNSGLIIRIGEACRRVGEKPTPACVNAGVGKSFISSLKDGKAPSVYKVAALAAYLGTTTSALLGEDMEKPDGQKAAELPEPMLDRALISALCQLSPEEASRVRDFVAGLKAARRD